jgi:hypothetical protein
MNDTRAPVFSSARTALSLPGRVTIVAAPDESRPDAGSSFPRIAVLVGVLALGVLLRVLQYWPERPFSHDEAALAVNLAQRSYGQLLQPLDFNQGAPVGFLFLQRSIYVTLGGSEHALRLVPFLCGIAALLVFPGVARQYVGANAALIAVVLFALGRPLIYYSAELKQYASDVLLALLLLGCAAAAYRRLERGLPAPTFLWGVLGAAALWFSHSAVFILAGTATMFAGVCLRRRDWSRLVALGCTVSIWLLSFAACYFLALRRLGQNDYLLNFWKAEFMPLPPRSAADVQWFLNTFFGVLDSPVGLAAHEISLAGIGALALVVGAAWLFLQRSFTLGALLLPVAFTLAASGLHKYPFGNRLILFLVPAFILVMAAGAEQVRARTWRDFRLLGASFMALLLFAPVVGSAGRLVEHSPIEPIKPLLQYVRDHQQPGDQIYVYTSAWPAYVYYHADYGLPLTGPVIRGYDGGQLEGYVHDIAQLKGRGRVWVVLVHHLRVEKLFRCELDRLGTRRETFAASPGAVVYLYDMGTTAE